MKLRDWQKLLGVGILVNWHYGGNWHIVFSRANWGASMLHFGNSADLVS